MNLPRLLCASALVPLVVACGGSSFQSGDTGSGDDSSSSGGTASSNDATTSSGNSGGTSSASGTTTTGSGTNGNSAGGTAASSTSGSATTGTGGGSGGVGGGSGGTGGSTCTLTCELARDANGNELCRCARPEEECEKDADCTLATNGGVCCGSCQDAYPKSVVDSEPCLVEPGGANDPKCEHPDCTNVLCPAIACPAAAYAACEERKCVPKYECPEGMLEENGRCVPPCHDNEDCVLATYAGNCCGGCPAAYNRYTVDQEECLVAEGDEVPERCRPDPKECSRVGCPQVLCVAPGEPVCQDDGHCESSPAPNL